MRKGKFYSGILLVTIAIISSLLVLGACSKISTPTTTPVTSTPSAEPKITITSPTSPVPVPGNVTVSIEVENFNIVDKQGQTNVAGQGHIHYFMDINPPTTPGQPAIPDSGSWAHVASASYTFTNVPGGQHTFSVELVNNDHTPLNPPVIASVNILVMTEIGPPNLVIVTPRDGDTLQAGDVMVMTQITNFNVVDKQGQVNVQHEGHLHFYLDTDAPTTQGQPAIPASGVWTHVAAPNYTFTNVSAGIHTISVELVNNDHTPLNPPVVQKISVKVTTVTSTSTITTTTVAITTTPTGGTPIAVNLVAQGMAFNMNTITVPVGASVTMNFTNKDSVAHNFALYTNSNATPPAIFTGQTITASSIVYKFTAPATPGTYFFRCDVHPFTMTGSFIVQ
jgi:plastocyanin